MMVNVQNVVVLNNPCRFFDPFQFEISFESVAPLQEDLEWKLSYVGSAESAEFDQQLESIAVGPVVAGFSKFIFEADPPDLSRIPEKDLLGVTVLLITCSYKSKEFIRIGYYVNVEYDTPELRENPPPHPDASHLVRNILAEKPKVTRFAIEWDQPAVPAAPVEPLHAPPITHEISQNDMSV